MPKGPRPHVPIRVRGKATDVKSHEKAILSKLSQEFQFERSSLFDEAVERLCTDIRNDPARLGRVAALIAVCLMDDNVPRASAQFLSDLAGADENGRNNVSSNTITSFAANPATNSWSLVYHYLRMITILQREEHHCTKHYMFQAVLAGCEDIEAFNRVFVTALNNPSKSEVRLSSIAAGGRELYHLINRAGGNIRQADILKLKASRAFEDVTYSTRMAEMPEPFLCVRSSEKDDSLILSYMQFSAVRDTLGGGPNAAGERMPKDEGVYIYNELYIGDSVERFQDRLVSTGYVVPEGSGVYIINHGVDGDGFMFMAFTRGEVFNLEREVVLRGVVLGLHRFGNLNPIVSRVVLVRRPGADIRLGQVLVEDFRRAMAEGENSEAAEAALTYLYDAEGAEIRSGSDIDGWEHHNDVELLLDQGCEGPVTIVMRRPLMAPTPAAR